MMLNCVPVLRSTSSSLRCFLRDWHRARRTERLFAYTNGCRTRPGPPAGQCPSPLFAICCSTYRGEERMQTRGRMQVVGKHGCLVGVRRHVGPRRAQQRCLIRCFLRVAGHTRIGHAETIGLEMGNVLIHPRVRIDLDDLALGSRPSAVPRSSDR